MATVLHSPFRRRSTKCLARSSHVDSQMLVQITPDPTTPAGFILRSNIVDMLDIFEVNRKDCARLLLEYPKWTLPGTFKSRPGAPPQPVVEGKNWELDNTLIEVCNNGFLWSTVNVTKTRLSWVVTSSYPNRPTKRSIISL